jgi:hypothetical protein
MTPQKSFLEDSSRRVFQSFCNVGKYKTFPFFFSFFTLSPRDRKDYAPAYSAKFLPALDAIARVTKFDEKSEVVLQNGVIVEIVQTSEYSRVKACTQCTLSITISV